MEKKVVLITGGASGIGYGILKYLLDSNKYEIISVSKGEKNIQTAKESLKDDNVLFLQRDITNEIYQQWSGMKASQYKEYKGLRKESLRDNMTDIEVTLADLGEIATRELVKEHKPYGLKENREMAKRGGKIAKNTRDNLEKELGKSVISKENSLTYTYIDDKKLIEDNKSKKKK